MASRLTRYRFILAAMAAAFVFTPLALALEGAETSTHKDWRNAEAHKQPTADERKKELQARKQAIQDEIKRLKERLSRVPSDAKMKELHTALRSVHKNYGWEPKSQLVYGRRSIEPMLKNQHTMPENLLAAFVQLDRDLKARDIDLIILPLMPTPHFHAHTLVEGIDADDEYFPGWTQMMIEMAEADLEVVDTVIEFRREAENPVLVSWANDFHTGSTGRQLAAKKLAERLQRYAWARELDGNQKYWTSQVREKTGASFPQRITTVNGAMISEKSYKRANKGAAWPPAGKEVFKGKRRDSVLADSAPTEMPGALRKRTFGLINLKYTGPKGLDLRRTELVSIGDSQLHSAVYGSGLPAFINAEVGGRFRWGSKSWSGFSPPEIYREVVPDNAIQPRVVVLTFLPKYFWHVYSRKNGQIDESANKYKPRPLPPLNKPDMPKLADGDEMPKTADTASNIPTDPFRATIKITQVSAQRDPATLTYDEALTHAAATVMRGPKPMVGQTIGVRHWTMVNRELIKKAGAVEVGDTFSVMLHDWMEVIEKDPKLAQHQIFDDTDLDLAVPVFWITDGPLSPKALRVRIKKD